LTQGLVEVVHLRQNADDCDEDKDVGARMGELVVTGKGQLDGNTDTLDGHDGDGADGAADGNIDQRVLASITRAHAVDHDSREDDDQQHIEEEACFTSVASSSASSLLSPNSPG
jgi:hypothetical protein